MGTWPITNNQYELCEHLRPLLFESYGKIKDNFIFRGGNERCEFLIREAFDRSKEKEHNITMRLLVRERAFLNSVAFCQTLKVKPFTAVVDIKTLKTYNGTK